MSPYTCRRVPLDRSHAGEHDSSGPTLRSSDASAVPNVSMCNSSHRRWTAAATAAAPTAYQGLTLVHLSAQRQRFLWDKGCLWGVQTVL